MYSSSPGGMPDPFTISSACRNCFGNILMTNSSASTFASAVWPSANLAMFFPFVITRRRNYVRAMVANGATVAGNVDIGIYALDGTRLFSTGSTAQAGTSQAQTITVDWTLDPGIYHLALALSSATATVIRSSPDLQDLRLGGAKQMASAMPLPASATFANFANGFFPLFGISEKTWV